MLNILFSAAVLLRPLMEFFAREVRRDRVIGTDDTSVTLLLPATLPDLDPTDPRSARIHEVLSRAMANDAKHVSAKMWAYRGSTVQLNVFDFTVSRHRDGPDQFLVDNGYRGILLGDCYSGYTGISLRSDDGIQHAACNAHARRKVFEARHTHPQVASVLLGLYQELYDIEDQGRPMDAAARLELRRAESVAVWERMREFLDGNQVCRLLPKESMAQAIGYLNNHWDALRLYLTDPLVDIDNNASEQLMKTIERECTAKLRLFTGSTGHYSGGFSPAGSSGVAESTQSGGNRMSASPKKSGRIHRSAVGRRTMLL